MSLEGLRAWIGEVERKLGKRTRVFLALAVIAIGLGGAAIYLAIDARESSVSESDVQELQEELEAQIDAAGGSAAAPAPEPVEPEPETEPAPEPEPKSGSGDKGNGAGGVGTGASPGAADSGVPSNADRAKALELLEQLKEQNADAEEDQAGK
jgi:hypothetical protein